ncbi:MAG: methyltransferase domain-containing protein [Acidimicrobiia bacterium]|nr:methyltransferase domain-containing protein [Acidimicrobiia bacterium]
MSDRIRDAYARVAAGVSARPADASTAVGYTTGDIASVPEDADLGLGCGTPLRLVTVEPGWTVLDLGSGAGLDCLLAAGRVGPSGRVIGIDVVPAMVERATANARSAGVDHVEFRVGDLRELPVADASVDLVISNCVISLVPDRAEVYHEARRVLRPGGHLAVSDTIVTAPLPEELAREVASRDLAWLTRTDTPGDYVRMVVDAGFADVAIASTTPYPPDLAFEDALVDELVAAGIPSAAIGAAASSMMSLDVVARRP